MPEEQNTTTTETPETQATQDPAEPVSLAEAKAQLRVEFSADDALISSYITAARVLVEKFLNTPLMPYEVEPEEEGGEPVTVVPDVEPTWKQAILLAVATWYQEREQGAFPEAAKQLLWYDRVVPV